MDLVPDNVAAGLRYLDVMSAAGIGVPQASLDAFTRQPAPRFSAKYGFAELAESLARPHSFVGHDLLSPTEYFEKVHWCYRDKEGKVRITDLGRALVSAVGPSAQGDSQSGFVRIDPDDPVAYARVFNAIAGLDEVLIVDRYLTRDGLMDLARVPSVSRVLTGRGKRLQDDGVVALTFDRLQFELRTIDDAELHDRWVIPRHGDPMMLGSSFNSIDVRSGVIVPLTHTAAATAIRADFDALWTRAQPVQPAAGLAGVTISEAKADS